MNTALEPDVSGIAKDAFKPARVMRSRAKRSRGVVMVEYAFLLAFFGVPVMLATAAAGIHLIQAYGDIRNDILGKGP